MILDSCSKIQGLMELVDEYVSSPLKIIAVVIFFVFTTIEYAKVVFSGDGSFKKANENTLKRIIGVLLLFFAPNIINLVLGLIETGACKIS